MTDRRDTGTLVLVTALGVSLASSNLVAQQRSLKEQLVGTWMIVSCEVVQADGKKGPLVHGSNPLGQFIFTDNGRFAFDKTIAIHIERSSIPNLNGTDGRRVVTSLSADEMNWTNPAPLGGGSISCANKRAK